MKAHLGLGTNLGDRHENLKQAIEKLATIGRVLETSKIYETSAWGLEEQDDFLNQVIILETDQKPFELLQSIQEIEKAVGRTKSIKWGPRVIDIDILFIQDRIMDDQHLIIPHPHIQNRNFVLVPLMELDPDFIHPKLNLSIIELYADSTDDCDVVEL
jgi:2-amino-4-hydroxy-6-hydroxymethyldihydropteridine diphosphokinase